MTADWAELAGRSLARQFPAAGRDGTCRQRTLDEVVEAISAIGPIQSQTARSPFLALAARLPGADHETLTAAYESIMIVRSSTIRGTVHTSIPEHHRVLDATTRIGQRALWARTLRLVDRTLEDAWAGTESYAATKWRTPAELQAHLTGWIASEDPEATPRLAGPAGRYFSFGHGGLLRRPLAGAWSGQGAPGYRTAATLLGDGEARRALQADPEAMADAALDLHLRAHGPSSRHDVAWWSGLGLRAVDAALARRTDLVTMTGPDGRDYHEPAGIRAEDGWESLVPNGIRLLPEFDALLCGYDPPARARFVDPDNYRVLWMQDNGQLLAPLLIDGRLGGFWRLTGSGRRRGLDVRWFAGRRRPHKAELDAPVSALASALGLPVTDVAIARH
ncbi:DNA glycosylase AlkZ-like family protein [Nostocoides vanveenii]|uniref:Crosslink repair DNA glycosylase YcaQ family protein n=1 Tax=Nostocoides vanveenii TaxID=330835 RepID=A0ABP4W1G5_9MICO